MRFAITGTDARFLPLRKLLLADGHEITDPASADMVISPPWDPSARYARREEYQIAIARLTAEGAIALLRPETGLSGAHILLLGYGRIARLLARELQKAGALVTAAARSGEQRAWAEAEGIEALPLDALSGALDRFDVIIGTIPAPVLTEPLLALVRKDALLLELASAPGGIDAAAAHERGLRYIRAPGLPAKYAPERAAVILRDAVYAAAAEPLPRLGLAVTGSHCTFSRALEAFRPLKRDYTLVPILSGVAFGTGLALEWSGLHIAALVAFWAGLLLGAYTFVPGAIRNLVVKRKLGIALLMTISAVGAVILVCLCYNAFGYHEGFHGVFPYISIFDMDAMVAEVLS